MTFFGHRAGNETWGEKIGDEPSTVMLPLFSVLSWLLFCIWAIVKGKLINLTDETMSILSDYLNFHLYVSNDNLMLLLLLIHN